MSPIRMSRIEFAVRAVLAFYEAFNRYDVASMMKLISDDCLFESAEGIDGTVLTGKEEIARFWQAYISQRPQVHIESEDIIGLGSRCIMRWRAEWEDADGEKRHIRGVDIFQFKEGLICKQYSYVKEGMRNPV